MSKPRLTRDAARVAAFYEVEVGEASFKCRVPSALELMAAGVLPPPIVTPETTPEEREKAARVSAEKTGEKLKTDSSAVDVLLSVVMVDPKLWRGAEDDCPEDAVSVAALGPFRDGLLIECLARIGYAEDRRKAVTFPDLEEVGAATPEAGGPERDQAA